MAIKQFKQIIGSLQRQVPYSMKEELYKNIRNYSSSFREAIPPPPKTPAPADCISTTFRGRRYVSTSLPRNIHSATFTEDVRNTNWKNEEDTKALIYGKSKLVLLHNRNSSLDRGNHLDIPLYTSTIKDETPAKIMKKTFKTDSYKDEKVTQTKASNAIPERRSYAKMIAEYSEAIDKKKEASKNNNNKISPRNLFPRLPFDSVLSSLTKLERPKIQKSRMGLSNSLSAVATKPGKNSSHTLTDKHVKTEKRKPSPKINKDSPKRDYFTKYGDNNSMTKIGEKGKDWLSSIVEPTEKQSRLEKSKTDLPAYNPQNEINLPSSNENNDCAINIKVDNSSISKTIGAVEKFNVLTYENGIEIQIPINTESQNQPKELNSKSISVLSLQISAKLHQRNNNSSMVHSMANYESNATNGSGHNGNNSKVDDPNNQPVKPEPNKKVIRKTSNLPWWASGTCRKSTDPSECLNDVYTSAPTIEVIATEEASSVDQPKDQPPKVVKVPVHEHKVAPPTAQRPRRKMTRISKIIEEKKKELKEVAAPLKKPVEKIDKDEVKKSDIENADEAAVKKADESTKVEKKVNVVESKDKKETQNIERKKQENTKNSDSGKKSGGGADNGTNNTKLAKSPEVKINVKVLSEREKVMARMVDPIKNSQPNIGVLNKAIQELAKKTDKSTPEKTDSPIIPDTVNKRRKDDKIDYNYKVKRITDPLKPIEKKKDGTLIDYGLKVPTRKPKKKPPENSNTNLNTSNIPKKTTSAPQQIQQLSPKSGRKSAIPLKVTTEFPKTQKSPKRISQSKSELPLNKITASVSDLEHEATIKKRVEENLASTTDKNQNKQSFGKSGNNSELTAKNNKDQIKGNSRLAKTGGDNNNLKTYQSEKISNIKKLPLKIISADENIHEIESDLNVPKERPEKELIYSVWLNRFHTRKHQILVK